MKIQNNRIIFYFISIITFFFILFISMDSKGIGDFFLKHKQYNFALYFYQKNASNIQYKIACELLIKKDSDQYLPVIINLLSSLSDMDYINSQHLLGLIYLNSAKVNDMIKAQKYFLLAAKKNYAPSLTELGNIYYEKNSIKDVETAIKYYEQSANQNEPIAQYNLALIYQFNPNYYDLEKAIYWYTQAAQNNYIDAIYNLGVLYYNGENELQPDLIKAFYWHKKGALLNYHKSQLFLGSMYEAGETVKIDYKQAEMLYLKSAYQGNDQAQLLLGDLYYKGNKEIKQNFSKAIMFYRKSAKQGNIEAQKQLWKIFLYHPIIPVNIKEAEKWLNKAIIHNDAESLYVLGLLHYSNLLEFSDNQLSKLYITNAAQLGYEAAELFLKKHNISNYSYKLNFKSLQNNIESNLAKLFNNFLSQ